MDSITSTSVANDTLGDLRNGDVTTGSLSVRSGVGVVPDNAKDKYKLVDRATVIAWLTNDG